VDNNSVFSEDKSARVFLATGISLINQHESLIIRCSTSVSKTQILPAVVQCWMAILEVIWTRVGRWEQSPHLFI